MAKANEIISLISGLTEEQLERLKSQIPPAEAGGLISPLKAVVGQAALRRQPPKGGHSFQFSRKGNSS